MKLGYQTVFCMCLVYVVSLAGSAFAVNTTDAGQFIIEPPTLQCAGFEWYIDGDDNRNASATVSFRRKGDSAWNEGLPLLRLQRERIVHLNQIDFTAPNMFAGSIFELESATCYECRFILSDPDGVAGETTKIVEVTTRSEPKSYDGGRILHVYPPDYEGEKKEPFFTGIMEAYYGSGNGLWGTLKIVKPGDTILVHAGVYKSDRLKYCEPLGLHFHGYYYFTQDGTPEKPIVIKGAGDGEAIIDGAGSYRIFDVMFADYTYIEGLTFRNADVAVYAGVRYGDGCDGLTVRNCRMENVGCGVLAQYGESRNHYIADNVILGRDDRSRLRGWTGMWDNLGELSRLDSFIGIDINGQGHVVCHNFIAYFHDAIDITEQGAPEPGKRKCVSVDIHNNDIYHMADDFIEADCSVHNIRVFNNRGFNAAQHGLSAQPIYGGPAYFIRNIVYHVPPGGAFKYNIYPSGVLAYHNTLIAEWTTSSPFSNVHLRNNLLLGIDVPERPVLGVTTYTSYTTFDYNGYRYNRNSENQFRWCSPGEGKLRDNDLSENPLRGLYATLEEFSKATGREKHGTVVDYDIFKSVTMPDKDNPPALYRSEDFDFSLNPGTPAVDSGCILPNINDGFSGKAPDLGALEIGQKLPVYGPRTYIMKATDY